METGPLDGAADENKRENGSSDSRSGRKLIGELTEQSYDSSVAVTYCRINLKMIGSPTNSAFLSHGINMMSGQEI